MKKIDIDGDAVSETERKTIANKNRMKEKKCVCARRQRHALYRVKFRWNFVKTVW